MYSCVFFGHRRYNYTEHKEMIKKAIVGLIREHNVTHFFSGNRGAFDYICVKILNDLKNDYRDLHITRVFSYIPQKAVYTENFHFDDTLYLLERAVSPRYAIIETNKKMVEKADYILSGVTHDWGGAAMAIAYARKKHKPIVDLFGVLNR